MERKPEKIEGVIPKMPMIEWFFYSAVLIMAVTFTINSTFTTFIGSIAWVFTSIVLMIHVILNDRMILPHTDRGSAMAFALGLLIYGLIFF